MPDTKARMVRWGWMCPMLLMTKAVKTKSRDTMGKGVAVRTISVGGRGHTNSADVSSDCWEAGDLFVKTVRGSKIYNKQHAERRELSPAWGRWKQSLVL